MSELLIAVKSCEPDMRRGCHKALCDTWVKHVPGAVDVRFFVGRGAWPVQSDEIRLDCGDSYADLPQKTWSILSWMLSRGYSNVFLCDVDTFVVPDRLLATGFREHDLYGLFNGQIGNPHATEGRWAWISGGVGYWLSRRAAQLIIEKPPTHWAEDCSVGQALGPELQAGRMTAKHDTDYGHCEGEWGVRVSKHHCTVGMRRQFDPQWQYLHYRHNFLEKR